MSEHDCGCGKNPYMPEVATVLEVITESPTIKSFRVRFDNEEAWNNFTYEPGQVGQLSVFGVGESTFVINSQPSCKDYLQFSVMRAGEVTTALHKLHPGDKVGVRAPLGNWFPYEDWKGKDIIFVGGGIGMAPIRTIMLHVMENAADYGKLRLLYGARTPEDMAFKGDLPSWLNSDVLETTLTVDRAEGDWPHRVGMIPNAIFSEAYLSYIGLGIPLPRCSWGSLAQLGIQNFRMYPWQLLIPAVCISLTMLAFNMFGDGLRDAFDPKLRR